MIVETLAQPTGIRCMRRELAPSRQACFEQQECSARLHFVDIRQYSAVLDASTHHSKLGTA